MTYIASAGLFISNCFELFFKNNQVMVKTIVSPKHTLPRKDFMKTIYIRVWLYRRIINQVVRELFCKKRCKRTALGPHSVEDTYIFMQWMKSNKWAALKCCRTYTGFVVNNFIGNL